MNTPNSRPIRRWVPYAAVLGLLGLVTLATVLWKSGRDGGSTTAAAVFCGPGGNLVDKAPNQSHRSYCVRAFSSVANLQANGPADFSFDIVDDRGQVLRDFATVHEKIMHVIVIRHDLTAFQHVHPKFNAADGRFIVEQLVLPSAGLYRLFADFTPSGAMRGPDGQPMPVTAPVDLEVGDRRGYEAQPLPMPADSAVADGYDIALARPDTLRAGEPSKLTFTIRRDGEVVTNLEPYLGANGHAVVLREGDLAFIHSHALEDRAALGAGELPFMVHFGEPGRYRMFVQFQHEGQGETAAFTLPAVVSASSNSNPNGHAGH